MPNKITQLDVRTPDGRPHRISVTQADPAPLGPEIATISSTSLSAVMQAPPARNEPARPPARRSATCPDCAGAGYYKEAVPHGHPHFGMLFPCACKLAEKQAHIKARAAEILGRLQSDLGSRLSQATFTGYTIPRDLPHHERQSLQRALTACRAYADEPEGWLYLYGPTGTGKSHLAAATALTLAQAGYRVAYASVPKLLRFIKAGFADKSSDDRILALMLVDLLVLDDLGAEYHAGPNDYNDQALFELLNERNLYDRHTIITSNGPRCDLEPRIRSRIAEQTREIHLDASDYRERILAEREASYGLPPEQRGAA